MKYWNKIRDKVLRFILGGSSLVVTNGTPPSELTTTQTMFLQWNAERLNIPIEDCRERYSASWKAACDGHAGFYYGTFNNLSHKLFQVFFNDTEKELYNAYQLHAPMHFLRMLSYPESKWDKADIVVQKLCDRQRVTILDYGCGLGQKSRGLAEYLKKRGVDVHLFLADIPTIRKDFLVWVGKLTGIETTFLDCTTITPIPKLPPCDICFVLEFFEHVYDPLLYLSAIHSVLKANGMLVTNISDHSPGFMHVSPRLSELRERLQNLGYDELRSNKLYCKNL